MRDGGVGGEALSIVRESSRIGKEAEKSFFVVVEEKMMSGSGGVHETMVKSESVYPGWSSPSLIISDLGVGGGSATPVLLLPKVLAR